MISRQRYPFLLAIGLGLAYALVARFGFDNAAFLKSGLLSLSFLVIVPLALGAITAHFIPETTSSGWPLISALFWSC